MTCGPLAFVDLKRRTRAACRHQVGRSGQAGPHAEGVAGKEHTEALIGSSACNRVLLWHTNDPGCGAEYLQV